MLKIKNSLSFVAIFLLLFLSFSLVFATDDIYDNWVEHNQTLTLDGTQYKAVTDSTVLILREINGTKKVVLVSNSTKQIDSLVFRVTDSKTTKYDYLDEHNISGIHSNDPTIYMHKLKVTRLKHNLKITREIEPEKPYLFDQAKVLITIKNEGNDNINGVTYSEKVAPFLKLTALREVESDREVSILEPNIISWKFNLADDESKTLEASYDIVGLPDDEISFELQSGSATYSSFGQSLTASVDKKFFPLYYPLDIDFTDDSYEVDYDSEFDFGLILSNDHQTRDIKIRNLEIVFPEGTIIEEFPDKLEKVDDLKYRMKGFLTIDSSLSEGLDFELKSQAFAHGNVSVTSKYTFLNLEFDKDATVKITPEFVAPDIDLIISGKSGDSLRGGDTAEIEFIVTNNEDIEISDALVKVNSDFFDYRNFIFKNIPDKNSRQKGKITNTFTVKLPSIAEAQKGKVNINVTFESPVGAKAYYTYSENINVAEGISDTLFSLTGEVLNFTNGTYNLRITVKKLTGNILDELSIYLDGENIRQDIEVTDEDIKQLKSSGTSRSFETQLMFNDPEPKAIMLDVVLATKTDGRTKLLKEEFMLNGSLFSSTQEIMENVDSSSGEEQGSSNINDPFASSSKASSVKRFQISSTGVYWIVGIGIGIIVIVIIIAGFRGERGGSGGLSGIGAFSFKKKKVNIGGSSPIGPSSNQRMGYDDALQINMSSGNIANKSSSVQLIPESGSGIDSLEKYINNSLSKGKSKDQIRNELKTHGWLDDVLDIFLK